jgi:hypothetical protein
LKKHGENVTSEQIINQLGNIFQEGIGIGDKLINISHDYGKQLDFVITKILVRSLKVKNLFSQKILRASMGQFKGNSG